MTPHTDAVIRVGGSSRQLQPLTLTAPQMLPPTGVPLPAQATAWYHPAETTILRPPWLAGRCCSTAPKVARGAAVRRSVVDSHASVGDGAVLDEARGGDRSVVVQEPSRGPVRGCDQMC